MKNLEKLPGQMWRIGIVTLLLALLAACGSGDDDDFVLDTEVARVDITPQNLVLTEIGEKQQLHAQAYNAADEPIDADIDWSSSNPANVGVDASGLLTAFNLGSAVISASAGGVESPPAMMIVATPAAGALLVRDRQVVESPAAVDPAGSYHVGTEYTVVLSGIDTPLVGDIVMGLETVPLAGRVVGVEAAVAERPASAAHKTPAEPAVKLTLAVVPVNELFEDLVIDEVLDLTRAEFVVSDSVEEYYTMQVQADGSYRFTARAETPTTEKRPGIAGRGVAERAIGTVANPYYPFDCEFSRGVGFEVAALSPSIELEHDLSLPIAYDSGNGGLSKVALRGQVKGAFKIKNQLGLGFEGKASCKLQLFEIKIPMPGPLAAVLGAQIPVGVGFEFGGKVTLADVGVTLEATAQLEHEFGVVRQSPGNWDLTGSLDPSGDTKTEWDIPPTTWTNDIRVEPSVGGFGYAHLAFGNPLFSSLRLTLAEMQGGVSQSANLGIVEKQVRDDTFKSDYKLSDDFVAKPGGDLTALLELMGVPPFVSAEFKLSKVFTTSPAASSASSDVSSFEAGDRVRFTVELDPRTINFYPLVYNVDEVRIYRKTNFGGEVGAELIASRTATNGATSFELDWVADSSGSIDDGFFVFVTTPLLPLPLLGELELGKVTAGSSGGAPVEQYLLEIQLEADTDEGNRDTLAIFEETTGNRSVSAFGNWNPSGTDVQVEEAAYGDLVWNGEFDQIDQNTRSLRRFSYRFDGTVMVSASGSSSGRFGARAEARNFTRLEFMVNEPVTISITGSAGGEHFVTRLGLFGESLLYRVDETLPSVPIAYTGQLLPGQYGLEIDPLLLHSVQLASPGSVADSASGYLELTVEFSQ